MREAIIGMFEGLSWEKVGIKLQLSEQKWWFSSVSDRRGGEL